MKKLITLILLVPLSGTEGSKTKDDPITVHKDAVMSYIKKGIAKFKSKKEHDTFVEEFERERLEADEREAEAKSISARGQLESELNDLYSDVVLKEAELNGVILNGEQILEMVEELKKRVLPLNGNYFDLNSLGGEK